MSNNIGDKDLETTQEQRTENVLVRLTQEEKETLVKEAQKAGMSISAFIRLLLRNWSDGIRFEKKNNHAEQPQ